MFLNQKVSNLYLVISNYNTNQASKMVGLDYLQSRKYVNLWKDIDLIKISEYDNRSFRIVYTAKGKRVYNVVLAAKTVLQNLGVQFLGNLR